MTDLPEKRRIYLDNAATSFPKPDAVYEAVDRYNRRIGAAVGRSAYTEAVEVERTVAQCRTRAAQLLNAESPDRVVFTFNATDGLNVAIHGVLRPGDHVVTSQMEHNSVLRPLREEASRRDVEVTVVPADSAGHVDPDDVRRALRPNTRLVVLIHASNVTGTLQPAAEVARMAHEAGALFLLDAAQTAGHQPVDVRQLGADLLACAGHKGLLGPLGTGLLYIRPGLEDEVHSLRQGGTGSDSHDDHQPAFLPDKYESGNHNAPGIFGLNAALAYLLERGVASIREHEQTLTRRLLEGLQALTNVSVYGPPVEVPRAGVVSFNVDGFDPQDLAAVLDEHFGIQVRAGLHCAPGAHRAIGTFDRGGTVRLSVGPFNSMDDVEATIRAVEQVAAG